VAPKNDRGFLAGLKSGWNAFIATFSAIATALGAALPFVIVLALIGVPLWRFRRSRRPAGTPAPAVATAGAPDHPDQS
jgi:hypothetical protein